MSKLIHLIATQLGGDIETVDVYHTSITPSNLLSSSVSAALLTGSGITFEVDDNVTSFYGYVSGGLCLGSSGSVTASLYTPNTRYFTFYTSGSDEGGTIEMSYPFSIAATENSFTASVNFITYTNAVVEATEATYPNDQFQGWYYSPTSSTPFYTDPTLTLTLNTYTGSDVIYAFFKDDA